jgi:uncharacterized protein YuzE
MKTVSLQITYRKGKPFAAYIYLARQHSQKSVRTEAVTEDLLIDYAQDGTPLGIEVVSPGRVSIDEIQRVFDRLGLGRLEPAELEPLKAA